MAPQPPNAPPAGPETDEDEIVKKFDLDRLDRELLGPPKSGDIAKAVWERDENNPEVLAEKREIRRLMGLMVEAMKEVVGKNIQEREYLIQTTRDMLEGVAKEIKQRRAPHVGETPQDVFDLGELVELRLFLEKLTVIDVNLWADMLTDPKFQKMVAILKEKGLSASLTGFLSPNNPNYQKNLDDVVDFYLRSKATPDECKANQSHPDFKKMTETTLWQETVRTLHRNQKKDLIVKLIERDATGREANDFISRCIITGVMTKREVSGIYRAETGVADSPFHKLGELKTLETRLSASVMQQEIIKTALEKVMKQRMEKPKIENAATYFLTFNRMAAETVARCGALTVLVNSIARIADRVKFRKPKSSVAAAVARGLGDIVTDPYVLGGAAVAAAGANVVWPYFDDMIYRPSASEHEKTRKYRADQIVKTYSDNHTEMFNAVKKDYPALLKRIDHNKRQGKGEMLTVKDTKEILHMTFDTAVVFGYPTIERAAEGAAHLFKVAYKDLVLQTQDKFDRYVTTNIVMPRKTSADPNIRPKP